MPDDRPNAAELYRALAAPVLGYLKAQGVPEAEDVLGEVFLQVARDLRRFSGDGAAVRRWVFSIAHNRAVDSHRRRARHLAQLDDLDGDHPAVAPPSDPLDGALLEALGMLSADQREVIVLRFVADLPLEAVARITRRSVGAVKALQHRAVDNLRRALDEE